MSEIQYFFEQSVGPERSNLYLSSLETIKQYLGSSIDDYTEEFIRNRQNVELETAFNQLNQFIIDNTLAILRQYGIKLNEEIIGYDKLQQLNIVLMGLLEIEHYEDPEYLFNVLQNNESNESGLAELISVVTDTIMEDSVEVIDTVNDELIHRLLKVLKEKVEESKPEEIGKALHPTLVKFAKSEAIQYVDEQVKKVLVARPYALSLESILRSFGNRLADDKAGQYTWVFVLLIATESAEEINPQLLYNQWGRYFLEETEMMTMYQRVNKIFSTLLGDQNEA